MPPTRLLSPSLHPVVSRRAFRLTIASHAAAVATHPTHSRFYSPTTSGSSQTQIKQHRPQTGQEEEQGLENNSDDDYYALLLSSPLPTRTAAVSSSSPTPAVSSTTTSTDYPPPPTPKLEPRVIFGSRLAGPAARQREGWAQERPKEPDNCCMSGCVNCVWDAYREEVEEWAARRRKREAEKTRAAQVGAEQEVKGSNGDIDGPEGGANHEAGALFEGVPVGIREFMALEKRLRERERDRVGGEGIAMP